MGRRGWGGVGRKPAAGGPCDVRLPHGSQGRGLEGEEQRLLETHAGAHAGLEAQKCTRARPGLDLPAHLALVPRDPQYHTNSGRHEARHTVALASCPWARVHTNTHTDTLTQPHGELTIAARDVHHLALSHTKQKVQADLHTCTHHTRTQGTRHRHAQTQRHSLHTRAHANAHSDSDRQTNTLSHVPEPQGAQVCALYCRLGLLASGCPGKVAVATSSSRTLR